MEQNLLDDGIDRSENLRGRANHDSNDVNHRAELISPGFIRQDLFVEDLSDLFVGFICQTGLGLWGEMWDQHIYYHAFQSPQCL